ncbi:hypothetical protein TSAR_016668 [Trichomalopsis sarcophagae]|uniref:Uncharacterized protein n=1 Tax=Trichomalopsis sarcophagae TaxID=543379 RepID=A0A232EDK8_9HYME|nr:hypothetical protein TSAR_016668 [Trichomalopsis sarcophagae]
MCTYVDLSKCIKTSATCPAFGALALRSEALLNERDLRRHTALQGPGVGSIEPTYNRDPVIRRHQPEQPRRANFSSASRPRQVDQNRPYHVGQDGRIHLQQTVYHCHVHPR